MYGDGTLAVNVKWLILEVQSIFMVFCIKNVDNIIKIKNTDFIVKSF